MLYISIVRRSKNILAHIRVHMPALQVLAMVLRSNAKQGQPLPAPGAEMDYCSRLNRALPSDIRVLGWTDVADEFHARQAPSTALRAATCEFSQSVFAV